MRVFVTGASGFVGSYAVAALLSAGHQPRALVRDPAKADRVLKTLGVAPERVEYALGDMLDAEAVRKALKGCDAAIHAAAAVGVTGGDRRVGPTGRGGLAHTTSGAHVDATSGGVVDAAGGRGFVSVNVEGTRNVVGGAVDLGLDPVVHVSTVGVFVPPDRPVITAAGALARPRTDYGRSKVAAERYARELQDTGQPVTIVYPGGVCGPHQPVLDSLMEGLAGALRLAWPMPRGGVSIVDVRDLGLALTRIVDRRGRADRWLLGGHYLTWRQCADLCDELTGVRCRRLLVPGWVMLGLGSLLDAAKRVRRFDYPLTRDAADFMVRLVPTDDGPALTALNLTLRPVEETLADGLRWLAAAGHLDPSKAGRLAKEP